MIDELREAVRQSMPRVRRTLRPWSGSHRPAATLAPVPRSGARLR